jgi:hypothetical protein
MHTDGEKGPMGTSEYTRCRVMAPLLSICNLQVQHPLPLRLGDASL